MPTRSIRWLSSPPAWLNFVSGSRGASVPFGGLAVYAIQRRPPNVHLHRDLSLTGGGISRRICAVRRACGRDTAAPSKRSSAPRSLAHRRRNLAAHLCRSEGLRYTRYSGALQTFICTAISRSQAEESRGASVPFGGLAVYAIQRRPPNVHLHRDLSLTGGGISRRICAVRRACGIRDTAAPSKRSSAPRSLAHRRRNLAAHLCRSEGLRYGRKPNGSLTRPTKNFVGMPGLRCPHYFVSEYL